MYSTALSIIVALAGLASAAPTPEVAARTSKGVKFLVAQSRRPGSYLSGVRVSSGLHMAVADDTPLVFWQNTTGIDANIFTDIPGVYPLGLFIQHPDEEDPSYPGEHVVSLTATDPTGGIQIGDQLSGPPTVDGTYMVCDREYAFTGIMTNYRVIRWLFHWETVPEGCTPVDFLSECAVLDDLPADSAWDHDDAQTVSCASFE
jgi:hypothetical protein